MRRNRWSYALAVVGAIGLAACSQARADRGDDGVVVPPREVSGEREPAHSNRLTDAQSAQLLTTLNAGEIDLARLALSRSQRDDVRTFANAMIAGHGEAQEQVDAWVGSSGVTRTQTPVSASVARDARAVHERLVRADHFDRDYAASQVAMHRDALRLIDERIMPGVRDASFRDLVQRIRGDVAHHLEMAQGLERNVR